MQREVKQTVGSYQINLLANHASRNLLKSIFSSVIEFPAMSGQVKGARGVGDGGRGWWVHTPSSLPKKHLLFLKSSVTLMEFMIS